MKDKNISLHQLTLNEFPSDILKEIFMYVNSPYHSAFISVCKNWFQIISEQYSQSVHGTMLRFSSFFLQPVRKSTEELAKLEKNLKHSAVNFTRNHSEALLFLLFVPIVVFFLYLGSIFYKEQPITEHEKWGKFLADNLYLLGQNASVCTNFEFQTMSNKFQEIQFEDFFRNLGDFFTVAFLTLLILCPLIPLELLGGYFFYKHYKLANNQFQNNVNDLSVDRQISNFFSTSSGKVILDIIHDRSKQYPPSSNNLTVSQLKTELLNDKNKLDTLSESFDKKVKQIFFSTKNIEVNALCSNSNQFKLYFLNRVKVWNETHLDDQLKTNEKDGIVQITQGCKMT